jgi:hypothetical protein
MTANRLNNSAEELLAKVFRSTPAEVRRFGTGLAPEMRVQLALFCYGRAHLREHGLALARECSIEELIKNCGAPMAATIKHQMEHGIAEPRDPTFVRKAPITLARGMRYVAASISDELESELA